jgi:hypothetical protein
MNSLCLRICLASLMLTLTTSQAAAEDGFRPLLNGQDLSGWVLVNTPPQTWSMQDGMLVCTGKPIGEIRTERMYQNFILEVEWRHMVPGGNAGIFVWADDITAKGVPFHRSIEVQVLENAYGQSPGHTTHGDIFPIHGATMTPVNGRGGSRAFPTEERSKPSPEWNHYRIECNDGAIRLSVNGKLVTQGTNCSPRKGYLCLESEGGVVHYRNMKIRELPETPIAPEQIAIANRGYRSLYNGLDLTGWTGTASGLSHWKSNDWVLAFDGQVTAENAGLVASETVNDRGFLFDIRPGKDFRELSLLGETLKVETLKPGAWYRVEASVQTGKLTLQVNGEIVAQNRPVTDPKLLFRPDGPAEFANLYVRDLK